MSAARGDSDRRVVILGPGPYEGMERPCLGDEMPEELRSRELEAAMDIPGLRRLVTGLAREGKGGYERPSDSVTARACRPGLSAGR